MSNKMILTTKLNQQLVMNQQLSQAITLLQYNSQELKQLVQQYIDTNPLIEHESIDLTDNNDTEDNDIKPDPSTNHEDVTHLNQYSADISKSSNYAGDESLLENIPASKSLRQHLLDQLPLCGFNSSEQTLAEAIIDAINDDGRLIHTKDEIIQSGHLDAVSTLDYFPKVLERIQQLDPPGIGAYTLQECLLIQIKLGNYDDILANTALNILNDYFDLLATNKLKLLQNKLKIETDIFNNAIQLIKSLDPKPGLNFTNDLGLHIEPELFVKKIRNEWKVFLAESILTKININKEYQNIIKTHKTHQAYAALSKELQEAQWLIKGLQRRNETLLITANQIIKHQLNFLEHGKTFMKPLNISDISAEVGLHESTISRVTTGKYIATPFGVFELKYFFPSYVLTDTGHSCSEVAVKEHIKEIVSNETAIHVYSDSDIAKLLKEKGINIARRTVAKYREALKILPSYQRSQQYNTNN